MPDNNAARVMPHSEEAERSVLGCMMLDPDAVTIALNLLSEEDFYTPRNRQIFKAIEAINSRGLAVDQVTVMDSMNASGNEVDPLYLTDLVDIVPTTKNIEAHCKIVSDKAVLRNMILKFKDISNMCYDEHNDIETITDEAQRFIYDVSVNTRHSDFRKLRSETLPMIERLAELHQNQDPITGLDTGFKEINRITSGFQKSDLILLAARPSMGKTTLAMNIAQNAAIRGGKVVAFFSLEMAVEQLVMRITASETGIESGTLRAGRQNADEWKRIRGFHARVNDNEVRLFMDDTSSISTSEVRSKLRKLKMTEGLDLVVIDYLQLMTTKKKTENRQQEISEISRDLKAIAKELAVPVLALSQLSRSPDRRSDARPVLSDLRESGAIEQDADIVMMIYRDYVYNKAADPEEAELGIEKHRNGETGRIKLRFRGELTKFEDAPMDTFRQAQETT